MKFQQPPAPNTPPKEANELEMAVYQYQVKAHEFHTKRHQAAPANETKQQREKRIAEWEEIRAHLEDQRMKVNMLADLEKKLEDYRKKAWGKTRRELLDEKYHPTNDLAKNLAANKEPQPSMKHTPHHIIPGKGRWIQDLLFNVRLKLHDCNIGINDPLNGVWLIRQRDHHGQKVTPDFATHPDTFGWNYEHWIVTQLRYLPTAPPNDNEYQVTANNFSPFMARLAWIKNSLKTGKYPIKITESKDPTWDGKL